MKKKRSRLNLTVDSEILDLVKKWSYISGLPISTLFDRVFEKETRKFKYESEEDWLNSEEYYNYKSQYDNTFPKQVIDFSMTEAPDFNFSDADMDSVGIERNSEGVIEISAEYPDNLRKMQKLMEKQVRNKGYNERWKEVFNKEE